MLSFITGYGNKANSSSAWSSAGADEPPSLMVVPCMLCLTIALRREPDQSGVQCLI